MSRYDGYTLKELLMIANERNHTIRMIENFIDEHHLVDRKALKEYLKILKVEMK